MTSVKMRVALRMNRAIGTLRFVTPNNDFLRSSKNPILIRNPSGRKKNLKVIDVYRNVYGVLVFTYGHGLRSSRVKENQQCTRARLSREYPAVTCCIRRHENDEKTRQFNQT